VEGKENNHLLTTILIKINKKAVLALLIREKGICF
jgi:hypothetical protein